MPTVKEVYDACENGDLDFIQNFLNSDLFKHSNQISTDKMLMLACFKNQLGVVKCIFDTWEARRTFKVLDEVRELVKITCEKGYFELTKFLLEQPELKDENANPDAPFMAALYCCSYEHLHILKYIFNSFPNDPLISKGLQKGSFLDAASEEGSLEIVKYLMESPDIKIKFGLQDNGNQLFRVAYDYNKFEILKYFIFELGLKRTEDIKEYMNHVFKKEVDNMFSIQELNKSLKDELNSQSDNLSNNKKFKM